MSNQKEIGHTQYLRGVAKRSKNVVGGLGAATAILALANPAFLLPTALACAAAYYFHRQEKKEGENLKKLQREGGQEKMNYSTLLPSFGYDLGSLMYQESPETAVARQNPGLALRLLEIEEMINIERQGTTDLAQLVARYSHDPTVDYIAMKTRTTKRNAFGFPTARYEFEGMVKIHRRK